MCTYLSNAFLHKVSFRKKWSESSPVTLDSRNLARATQKPDENTSPSSPGSWLSNGTWVGAMRATGVEFRQQNSSGPSLEFQALDFDVRPKNLKSAPICSPLPGYDRRRQYHPYALYPFPRLVVVIFLLLFLAMSTYAGGGSRGFQPDPKVVAAATLIHTAKMNNMRAPTAKKAMAGLFSEDEINDESKQRNVRRTAQKMEEQAAEAAAEATGTATASTTAKRSSSTAGSKSNKKKKQAAKQGPTTKKASKSSSVTPPPPIKNAASAPKAYTLTSKQVVQQEAADKKQQAKYNDAFAEATTMWSK